MKLRRKPQLQIQYPNSARHNQCPCQHPCASPSSPCAATTALACARLSPPQPGGVASLATARTARAATGQTERVAGQSHATALRAVAEMADVTVDGTAASDRAIVVVTAVVISVEATRHAWVTRHSEPRDRKSVV